MEITCEHCGRTIELSKVLTKDIEKTILAGEQKRHEAELEKVRQTAAAEAKRSRESAIQLAQSQAQTELEIAKEKLEADVIAKQRKATASQELALKSLKDEAEEARADSKQLREQLGTLMGELRRERKAKEDAEIDMQKKLAEEESKIRDEATKQANERQRLDIAARDKTIGDLQKALSEAQRKAAQGSQQLQGEIMELDLETALAGAFGDDEIMPVAKGVKGGDIKQVVKSPRGTECGVLLWEIKRTKHWTDGWIGKLKADLRAERANIAIIISEAMPKTLHEDMGQVEGVWVCKPQLAIVLSALLRKGLLDVGREKAVAEHRGTKAESLFTFVTSHEFIQQVESMLETYQEMQAQVQKERIAYEKLWAQREKQAQKLYLGTANIIGGMQGQVGQSSMPRIKGLELLDDGQED